LKALLLAAKNFGYAVDDEHRKAEEIINSHVEGERLTPEMGVKLLEFWNCEAIQKAYSRRNEFWLLDSFSYYIKNLERFCEEDFLPTEEDSVMARIRTTGIVVTQLEQKIAKEDEDEPDQLVFKVVDVGGQRNERKKWIHCFENVTAVLFVAAISEYDQVLYEDENTNRMVEALNLFEEICNSRWFRETSMILFLNKRDLFAEKIKKVPLSKYFPDYSGDNSFEAAAEFLQEQFESKNRNPDKQVYTHITCATDTGNIAAVFNAVKDIIIRKSLNEAGLV